MNIHSDDPKWTAYVLGELSDAERAEVERELESSAEAREIVDEIRMTTMLLKDELANEAPLALHAGQREAIVSPSRAGVKLVPAWSIPRWVLPGFAAAAVGALVIVGVIMPSLLRSRQAASPAAGLFVDVSQLPSTPTSLPPAASVEYPKQAGQAARAAEPQFRGGPPEGVRNERVATAQSGIPSREELKDVDALQVGGAVETARNGAQGQQGQQGQDGTLGRLRASGISGQQGQLGGRVGGGDGGVLSGVLKEQRDAAPPASSTPEYLRQTFVVDKVSPVAAAAPPPPPPGARPDVIPRPRFNTEAYDRIEDNPFKSVAENPLATFSIDVDTASYANVRRFLTQNQIPPRDSVRIEELINYFTYDYPQPTGKHPLAVHTEVAAAPWKPDHRLVRIGVKAKDIDMSRRPPTNLVFLIDVSGSMMPPEKLPLLKSALKLLVDKLTENDRVAIAVYAGNSGLVLPSTTGDKQEIIIQTLDRLEAGGSTNGAGGIQLAYDTAVANFIKGGINRVILCTDGDFNVGITNQGDLTRLIEDKAKSGVFLSVLGFGMGNLKDSTMEKLADRGNGNYAYIDSLNEARKVLVEEMGATLMTVAKDVKIQVDFNPAQVNAYRLIGYENRVLRNEDFNDDTKDAGDMGAGHTVTALFEVVPRGLEIALPAVETSKYRELATSDRSSRSNEMLTVRVRYKLPDASESTRFDVPLIDRGASFDSASADYRFAAAVAEFGMILRESPYKAAASLDHAITAAEQSKAVDKNGYREEFVKLARRARAIRELR